MAAPHRTVRTDLQSMRRSLAMSSTLPAGQALPLLDEVERLLDEVDRLESERAAVASLVGRIESPYREARLLLVELSRMLAPPA